MNLHLSSTIRAFLLGVTEFRLTCTTRYEDLALADAYDRGRAAAHFITFHYFDHV